MGKKSSRKATTKKKNRSANKPSSRKGKTNWMAVGVIAVLVLFGLTYVANLVHKSNPNGPINRRIANMPEPQFRKDGTLSFLSTDSSTISTIDIEIVESPRYVAQGLMYRKSMKENQGMLFIMPTFKPQSFWMKNTFIPLDIIYADTSGLIVSIQKNTTPLSETSIPSGKAAQFVVEVNAGYADKKGVEVGDLIQF